MELQNNLQIIENIKEEHEVIERELLELETISLSETINYPNLIHVFNKLINLWDEHELKEERFFPTLAKENLVIPIKKMLFEHESLRKLKEKMRTALNSGDNEKIKRALDKEGKEIIKKLKDHIRFEDEIIYTLPKDF